MARLNRSIVVLVAVASAEAASIQYGTIPKSAIEERLRAAPGTNASREQKLREMFEKDGCAGPQLEEQPVRRAKAPNVICAPAGQSGQRIVIGGHFDFVDTGQGVVDNWTGSSMLPSLFLSLKTVPRRHTFLFIGFTDEEKGMVGSQYYVHSLGKTGLSQISAMVNLDSLGTNPTKLERDRGDKRLVNALAAVAATFQLPLNVVNVHAVGRSDSDSFQDRKIPTINIHSRTQET